ncbi:MAG: hypothetical protein ACOVOO_01660 [Flavobacteriales bacterium]|jgi:hypothetical protein
MRLHPFYFVSVVSIAVAASFSACTEPTAPPTNPPLADSSSVSSSGTVKFQGEIISVPSPTQIAVIIQKANIPYKAELVNSLNNRTKYTSEIKKALNMGTYGADLAYIGNYEKGQINNDYFEAVGSLANDLQILDHVDKSLISRLSNNVSNRDSLLSLNAQFFRAGDRYLKNAERADLAGLILFGGWIEALHISLDAATTNKDIRTRIGEQKHAANSLLNLLNKYDDAELDAVKSEMVAISEVFMDLESTYKFEKPINDSKNKTTYLRSKTGVIVSDDQLTELREHVNTLRNLITQ